MQKWATYIATLFSLEGNLLGKNTDQPIIYLLFVEKLEQMQVS